MLANCKQGKSRQIKDISAESLNSQFSFHPFGGKWYNKTFDKLFFILLRNFEEETRRREIEEAAGESMPPAYNRQTDNYWKCLSRSSYVFVFNVCSDQIL